MVASNLIEFKQGIPGKKVFRELVLYAVAASEIALIAQFFGAGLPLILFSSLVTPLLFALIIKITAR